MTHRERIDALAIQALALARDFCATLLMMPKTRGDEMETHHAMEVVARQIAWFNTRVLVRARDGNDRALNPTPRFHRGAFSFLIPSDAHPILFDYLIGAGKKVGRHGDAD